MQSRGPLVFSSVFLVAFCALSCGDSTTTKPSPVTPPAVVEPPPVVRNDAPIIAAMTVRVHASKPIRQSWRRRLSPTLKRRSINSRISGQPRR